LQKSEIGIGYFKNVMDDGDECVNEWMVVWLILNGWEGGKV